MELFLHKFVTVSHKKLLGHNCSELYFAGTNLPFTFLSEEEKLPLSSKYAVKAKEIKAELSAVRKVSGALLIKGGEPLLQSGGLKSIIKHAKHEGFLVGLETYGTKPAILQDLLKGGLIDVLILKLYCPLTSSWMKKMQRQPLLLGYDDLVSSIKKTIEFLPKAKCKVVVRTLLIPDLLYKKNDIMAIAKSIRHVRCFYELISCNSEGKILGRVTSQNKEFIDELKEHIKELFPKLHMK